MDSRTSFDTIQAYFIESLPRQLGEMASNVRLLQSHLAERQRQAAFSRLKDSSFAVASGAEALGMFRTAQRARSLLLFIRTLPPRKGVYESDEVLALTRAFNRLLAAVKAETGQDAPPRPPRRVTQD